MARRNYQDERINRPNTLAARPYNGTDSRVIARGPGNRGASAIAGLNQPAMPVGVNPTDSQVRKVPIQNAGYVANGGSMIRVNTPPTPVGVNPSDSSTQVGAAQGRGITPAVHDVFPIMGTSERSGEAAPPNPNPGGIAMYERRESGPKDYQPPVENPIPSMHELVPPPSQGNALMAAASSRPGMAMEDTPTAWGRAPEGPMRGTPVEQMGGADAEMVRRRRAEARNQWTA
jgi:hypothetical protein